MSFKHNEIERNTKITPKKNSSDFLYDEKNVCMIEVLINETIIKQASVSISPAKTAIPRCVPKICSEFRNWLKSDRKKTAIFGFKIAIKNPSTKLFVLFSLGKASEVLLSFVKKDERIIRIPKQHRKIAPQT